MEIIIALLLVGLSGLMLLQLKIAHKFAKSTHAPSILVDLVFFFCYVKILLYYLTPGAFRLASDFYFERMDGIDPWSVFKLYVVEFISWSCYLISLVTVLAFIFKRKKRISDEDFLKEKNKFAIFFITLSAYGFIILIFSSVLGVGENAIFDLYKPLFFYCGLTAGPVLILISGRWFSRHMFFLGAFVTLLGSFAVGTRGAIVYMVIFIIFLAWRISKDKRTKKLVFILIGTPIILYIFTDGLPGNPIKVDEAGVISLSLQTTVEKSEGRTKFQELDWRFGASTRLGTAFFEMYDRGDSAGIKPILHSLVGFLPRSLNPNKPIPSTVDPEDVFSQGMYLIYREVYGYDNYSMSEFPTGAHFYWEFGMLGVVVLSIVSACYIAISLRLFSAFGYASIPLVIALFKPWGYMDPKIWISDAAMQIYQIYIPAATLFFAHKIFYKISNGIGLKRVNYEISR